MDIVGTIQRALVAMRELLSVITRQINSRNEDTFLHRALKFVQSSITTLEQLEQMTKKQWNALLNIILLTAGLVAQNLSSETAYNAIFWVSREIGGLFDGSIPESMQRNNDELQHLLAAASAKMTDIQTSCYWLMEQVIKACESCYCSPLTVRRLEAHRLRISADIKDCEITVNNAHDILEMLYETAKREAVKLGLGLAVFTVVALGLGFGSAKAIQAGNRLGGGLLGGVGMGCAVLCFMIARKLGDYKVVCDEVNIKRNQYRQISTRLESLKAMVDREMQGGVKRIRMPDLERAVIILLALLVAFGSVMVVMVSRGQTQIK